MSLEDYVNQRRRNKVKKQLRKAKPHLFGQQLENEVDKIIGVSDSGAMDWTEFAKPKEVSEYDTPESVYPILKEVAQKYGIRTFILFHFYKQKILSYKATGAVRNDYKAVLEKVALQSVNKKISRSEVVPSFTEYLEITGKPIDKDQILISLKTIPELEDK